MNGRVMGIILAWACTVSAPAQNPVVYTDVTPDSGIQFVHTDGSGGRYFITETVASGLGLLDYDLDGDLDIYFVNGAPLPGTESQEPPLDRLYRNDGNWKFTDVTLQAGVGDPGYGIGCAVGDYDNDGDPDLYITNCGPNVLYRNNGDGTFSDVTEMAGVGDRQFGAGAGFADFDGDGWLDLYVGNYLVEDMGNHAPAMVRGFKRYSSPSDGGQYPRPADVLYRNNRDGTFTDISRESGITAAAGLSLGVVCSDVDTDGDLDVYVACDVTENLLWINDGKGKFTESGLLQGCAYDFNGDEQGSMGVAAGDPDNDGDTDIYVTNYQYQYNTYYQNDGQGFFMDTGITAGVITDTFSKVGWGTGFIDYDNDGDQDLFVANGHLQDTIDSWDQTTNYRQRNMLFQNKGTGLFTDVTALSGEGLAVLKSSRGAAFGDLDNDGDVDIVINNSRDRPSLLRNDGGNQGHWIQFDLHGTLCNRDAVGARIYVTCGGKRQFRERFAGGSYCSSSDPRLHFGLGDAALIGRVEIVWPGGHKEILEKVSANQILSITESGK